jgi:hypothetical protein
MGGVLGTHVLGKELASNSLLIILWHDDDGDDDDDDADEAMRQMFPTIKQIDTQVETDIDTHTHPWHACRPAINCSIQGLLIMFKEIDEPSYQELLESIYQYRPL